MLELAPKPHTPTATAPATRWRNYYRLYRVLHVFRLGTLFPGIHAGPDLFPSQELAEENARNFVKGANPPGRWLVDHAGAFPEGDRPN